MNRWLKVIVIIVFSCTLLFGCDDDDFAPYTNIDYDVSIHLKSNIFVISEAKQELSQIVAEYAKDIPLTYVHYEIYGTKGTAEFQFFGGYENGENRATCITLYVDINTNNVIKINYEDGHGKRMSSVGSREIKQTANINIMDVYNREIADRSLETNECIGITVTDAEIFPYVFIKDNKVSEIEHKDEEGIGTGMAGVMIDENQVFYTTKIVSYTKNNSYVEYPRISGLEEKKENAINKILEDQVLYGAKNYKHKAFVDFSDSNYYYLFKTRIGFVNKDIASFIYTFDRYPVMKLEDDSQGNISRNYGVTIDIKTGKKIELWDFMKIDERLINSNDGSNIKTDYTSAKLPKFHNFKDAFEIYSSKEEKDSYHIFSVEEIIQRLKDKRGETNWYIDDNKNIVFYYGKNRVKIPYSRISDAIYPKYLNALNE